MSNDHANDSKPRCRGVEMNHIARRWDECCLWVSGLTLRLPDCSCTMAVKVQTDGPQYVSDNSPPHGSCCAFVRHERSFPKPDTEKHRMETVGVAEGQDNLQLRPQRARGRQRLSAASCSCHRMSSLSSSHATSPWFIMRTLTTHLCVYLWCGG